MALFALSADDSKQLVTALAKQLSATERSSWVNRVIRPMTPFFPYYLNYICWEISFFAFQDLQNSVPWCPPFALCFGR